MSEYGIATPVWVEPKGMILVCSLFGSFLMQILMLLRTSSRASCSAWVGDIHLENAVISFSRS
jgi:hypothetical protein